MLSSPVLAQIQTLGIPVGIGALVVVLAPVLRWFLGPPMDSFHRWRESKHRDREYFLKIADQSENDLEASWVRESLLQEAFRQRHGLLVEREERLVYSSLMRRYSPSIKWRHIRGISTLARRSEDGTGIELHMPSHERRWRYIAATAGTVFYLFGSFLLLEGLLSAMHGSWAGIVVGLPIAVMGAVTTRVSLFAMQSYDAIGRTIRGKEREEFMLIPIPEPGSQRDRLTQKVPLEATPRRRA